MKKIMSLMLGLSLLSGMAVFAQDKPAETKATTTKSTKASKSTTTKSTKSTVKAKKKKATTTSTMSK
jgi:hypothetical protein